jgi:phosphatidylglycerol---prolipoprotein diacylglyceryl transferase
VLLLGLAIQRAGCFLAGCCFGRPTGLPWGVHFPAASPAGRAFPGEAVHPTQLYYLLAFLLVAGFLWLGRRRLRGRGMAAAAGLFGVGIAYAAITTLRGDLGPGTISLAATTSTLVALSLAAAGLALGAIILWKIRRNDDIQAESRPAGPVRRRA